MHQFREYVIRPVLQHVIMHYSYKAELLLAGTAAQESGCFRNRKQQNGPGLGLYQMEPDTYKWLWKDVLGHHHHIHIARRIKQKWFPAHRDPLHAVGDLVHNDQYATAMARVRYMVVHEPIPHVTAPVGPHELESLANYWSKYYNTQHDAIKTQQFIDNFKRCVENTN